MRKSLAAWMTGACLLGGVALAQDATTTEDRDRGVIQAFLEDNLSGAGRDIRIEGFSGALSSSATLDTLTIADEDGVWLRLSDVVLDWNRTALFSGRVEVNTLSAASIELTRRPKGVNDPEASDAEAKPFALPDLPVSVQIAEIAADRVILGEPILGRAAEVTLSGGLSLADGEGTANLSIVRIDGEEGALTLSGGYANATDILSLDLSLTEGQGGIVSGLMKIPDAPALSMSLKGTAPLSDYAAEIGLATDGVPRLSGTIRTSTSLATDATETTRLLTAEVGGDIAPLFAPDMAGFFGDDIQLDLSALSHGDGRLELSQFALEAASIRLLGDAEIGADGLPLRFSLTGDIAAPSGSVVLPLSGPTTTIGQARLEAAFDAEQGDAWSLSALFDGFDRDGLSIAEGRVDAGGVIRRDTGNQVTAVFDLLANGIATPDPALSQALGSDIRAQGDIIWQAGAPLSIRSFDLTGAGLTTRVEGTLGAVEDGLPFTGTVRLGADDMSRFAAIAKRPVAGGLSISVDGMIEVLSGRFDLGVEATTRDAVTGISQVDGVLAGRSYLSANATRGADGIHLSALTMTNDVASVAASGMISGVGASLDLSAALTELGLVMPELAGPAEVAATLGWVEGQPIQLSDLNLRATGGTLTGGGSFTPDEGAQAFAGSFDLTHPDLSRLAAIAKRPLRGSVTAKATGGYNVATQDFDIALSVSGRDLAAGLGDLDRLIGGGSTANLIAARTNGRLSIENLTAKTPVLSADVSGDLVEAGSLAVSARLSDLALLLPDFAGPLSASGTISPIGSDWRMDISATGPGGTTANVRGTVAGDGKTMDLSLAGTAPLGLANSFIAPRQVDGLARFDLLVAGAPSVSSLSGQITTNGASLSAPTLGAGLEQISATITLSGGRASIDMAANVREGGRMALSGPVTLSAPFDAALQVDVINARVIDPLLYSTQIAGGITINGPLAGGARIEGVLDLIETEVQVPSTGVGASGSIPDGLTHINEPTAVRVTRDRAGLIAKASGKGGGAAYGLDLLIRAPNRIFVRGRGLDAELGGQLRVSGDTANVIPQGSFDLIRGRLDILGERLILNEGSIRLQGAFDPVIRLVASTQADDTLIQVILEGPATSPEVVFTSQPELPQDEVLARLLFNRDMASISPLQALQLANAVATLAGKTDGGLLSGIRQNFGLDDLDVASDGNGGTVVKAGKYISENVYSDVSVDSEGKTEVRLHLDLTPQISINGMASSDGNTGVGIFFERDY